MAGDAAWPEDAAWPDGTPGLFVLPSGLRVRGRGIRAPLPPGPPPQFGVYLLLRRPPPVAWESRWVRWPDLGLPLRPAALHAALAEVYARAGHGRVEVACAGGVGRTGTALALLAVLDGVPPHEAVAYVRRHYRGRAVETPWQRRLVHGAGAWSAEGGSSRRPSRVSDRHVR